MKSTKLQLAVILFLLIGMTAILPAQAVIKVAAGTSGISAAYATAKLGDVIELTTSGGEYLEMDIITITKDITIRAAAGLAQKPVMYVAADHAFDIAKGGLTITGIKVNGVFHGNSITRYGFFVKPVLPVSSADFSLRIDKCEIVNLTQSSSKGVFAPDDVPMPIDSVIITNTVFDNIPSEAVYLKTTKGAVYPGTYKYFKWENCLVTHIGGSGGDGFAGYIEPASESSVYVPTVIINHLTVATTAVGGIYVPGVGGSVITNSIVVKVGDTTRYAFYATKGSHPKALPTTVTNCLSFNANHGVSADLSANILNANPLFADTANGNYTLLTGSPGKKAGNDGLDLGYIPGGLRSSAKVIAVAAGTSGISAAYATANLGDVIELTTSGGEYLEMDIITITKDITIRAAAGLAQKPVMYVAADHAFDIAKGGLTITGIKVNGVFHGNSITRYGFFVKPVLPVSSADFSLRIDKCEIVNLTQSSSKGVFAPDDVPMPINSVIITNTVFDNIPSEAVYLKTTKGAVYPGTYKYFKWENCLVTHIGGSGGDGFAGYIESASGDSVYVPTVIINHLTVATTAVGGIYVPGVGGSVMTNSIVVNVGDTTRYAFYATKGSHPKALPTTVANCLYFNANHGVSADVSTNVLNANPMFADTANRNYTLLTASPGKGKGSDGKDLGYIPGGLATAVESHSDMVPESFQLPQNYPNPFNPTTTIQFNLPKAGRYSIRVFNVLGQEVARLFDNEVAAGIHMVNFDASRLASGVYVYTLEGNSVNISKKMMLLK